MLTKLRSYLGSRFWGRTFAEGSLRTWMSEEAVREYVNESVTGSPNVWPIEWLQTRVPSPFRAAVSIGCGEGALERDLLSKGMCTSILGVDLSREALQLAEAKARAQGLSGVRYEQGDMNSLDLPEAAFDAAFFHQSLHHAEDLDSCLAATAASLKPGALVYLDEYVGPSRGEWSFALLEAASEVYASLPPSVRRSRRLKLPVDWRDPTEAVRSSEILAAVRRHFEVLERRDYGGNFLAVIHPHLRLEPLTPQERAALLRSIIAAERAHLAEGHASYYTVLRASAPGSQSSSTATWRPACTFAEDVRPSRETV